MRTLEALLLWADLMALATLAALRWRAEHRWRPPAWVAIVIALALALAQVGVEGPRWQMVPAYGLTLLISMARRDCVAGKPCGRAWPTFIMIGLGMAAFAISVALPMVAPVFGLPAPTGPYAIGTLTYHWVDAARSEAFAADARARRELMVQIWYPAQAQAAGPGAAYLPDAGAVTAAFARIHRMPAFVFGHLQYVTTHARPAAPAASGLSRFPVLLFLAGATGFRQMNTYQVESLVSHGYIVVAMDQPGAAAAVVFPDGHQIAGLDLAQIQATVGPSYRPRRPGSPPSDAAIPPGLAAQGGGIIPYLAADVVSLAFFDRHLLGRPAGGVEGLARQYPEARFESRRP